MTEKFTPGKWEIEEHELSVKNCEMFGFRIKTDSKIICAANSNELKNKPEMRANAALIAAAPEMYECICDALSDLQMSEGMKSHFEAVLRKARG